MSRRVRQRARRQAAATLAATPLPRPWALDDWVDALEQQHHRPIDLVPMVYEPGGPIGAWRALPDRDVIAYAANTSLWHQDYVAVHEIAHMVSGHQGRCMMSAREAVDHGPELGDAALQHLLTRVTTDTEEVEAETIATIVLAEATVTPPMIDPTTGGRPARRARRFSEVFA